MKVFCTHCLGSIGFTVIALSSNFIVLQAHAADTAIAKTPKLSPKLQTTIGVGPNVPIDIPGGAPNATLTQAAFFAWEEFIALNWPAVPQNGNPGTRDKADPTQKFGAPSYTGPLAWHTYRGKVEIFPGTGVPPGGVPKTVNGLQVLTLQPNGVGYGYDFAPTYNYGSGAISPASGTPSATTPWINLDENSQIGLNNIYAGVAAANASPLRNEILFLAKANRAEFDYIAPKGWWDSAATKVPFAATVNYIAKYLKDPAPGAQSLVSLPSGTIELKSSWRKLAPTEDATRFYTTKVRYYINKGGTAEYVDDTLALIGLHIIQKTPSAPYFIFATFEQADNITDASGKPVEDVNGNFIGTPVPATAFTPDIVSTNATPTSPQTFTPTASSVTDAQGQLNYANIPNQGLPTGTILVNRRKHPIASEVIAANMTAHQVIADYMKANFSAPTASGPSTASTTSTLPAPPSVPVSPWAYYKLVSVQSKPIDKTTPGMTYDKPDASTYYQANSTIETDYDLQVFSGRFYTAPKPNVYANTITDYTADGKPFKNVAYNSKGYLMGGCMGCHGNAQNSGFDFSFILGGGRVASPDTVGTATSADVARFKKYFHP